MRWLAVFFAALFLFAVSGFAETEPNHTFAVPSGASNYGLDLGAYTYCQAVYAWDADIGVEFVLNGVEVDSVGLARGGSASYTVHCDSINIVRTSATAVTVLLGYPNGPCPNIGPGDKVALRYQVPVTVSEHVVFTNLNIHDGVAKSPGNLLSPGYRTFPVTAAADVHGAKALYLVLDWTDYEHGGFSIVHKFGPSNADTLFSYFDGAKWSTLDTIPIADTLTADSLRTSLPHNAAGSLVLRIPDLPGEGYYYTKIRPWGTAHANWITGLNGTLVVVQ